MTNPSAVLVVQTQEIFESVAAAALAKGIPAEDIDLATKQGVRCHGYDFKILHGFELESPSPFVPPA
eukprot:g76677.t1